jgi:hypothetical protein
VRARERIHSATSLLVNSFENRLLDIDGLRTLTEILGPRRLNATVG